MLAHLITLPADLHGTTAGRTVPIGATWIYELSFLAGFGVSFIVYRVLNRLFSVVGAAAVFEEIEVLGYESKSTKLHVGVCMD